MTSRALLLRSSDGCNVYWHEICLSSTHLLSSKFSWVRCSSSILCHFPLDAQCFGKVVIFYVLAFLADGAQDPPFVGVVALVVLLVAHSRRHLFVGRLLALVVLLVAHPQWL